ncbi:MAG: squalene/phytoene synthase family protein [Legionellales bacterium]
MQPLSFYQVHLEAVSRSFSFCILQLPSPEKERVALAYLLCRIVDTIEDSNWPDEKSQFRAFRQLKEFLSMAPSEEQFLSWLGCFPETVIVEEKNLLADLPRLILDKNELPPVLQNHLVQTVNQMIAGMSHFLTHYRKNTKLVLNSLELTNQYCFFAAGIVGLFLSQLFTNSIPKFEFTDTLHIQSFHFGFFLQKINLLKDQRNDQLAGRCFVSSYTDLRTSLVVNACHAFDYLKAIPLASGRPYRLFCAWSLFIGLALLKWIDKGTSSDAPYSSASDGYKLGSREGTYIIKQISRLIDDNDALDVLFKKYLPEVNNSSALSLSGLATNLPDWFTEIYDDPEAKQHTWSLELSIL